MHFTSKKGVSYHFLKKLKNSQVFCGRITNKLQFVILLFNQTYYFNYEKKQNFKNIILDLIFTDVSKCFFSLLLSSN